NPIGAEAQVLNALIGGAKKEPEIAFTAGPSTFGGRQAFSELQAAFNKKFGLNARINFTAGTRKPALGRPNNHPTPTNPPTTPNTKGAEDHPTTPTWARRRLKQSFTTKGYWSESTIRAYFPG